VFFTKKKGAIRSIWESQIRSALDACLFSPNIPRIPLTRSRDTLKMAYRSAIALQLAPQLAQSPLELAQKIVAHLPETADVAVIISPPGWIDCQLTDVGLAQWLQQWTRNPIDLPPNLQVSAPADEFSVQYAHARCCALLRLADAEGLIAIQSSQTDLEIISPDPLPWLDETQSLRLQHPAERALICQLVAVVDALEDPAAQNYGKLAMKLSEAFEEFYSQCRIFGEVNRENSPLAIGRSGLVGVTQKVLKCLLDKSFGILSPIEL
jgi:arginyl-tRNA synthetase